jgi:hypothetical protein
MSLCFLFNPRTIYGPSIPHSRPINLQLIITYGSHYAVACTKIKLSLGIVTYSGFSIHDGGLLHWKFNTQLLITVHNSSGILTQVHVLSVGVPGLDWLFTWKLSLIYRTRVSIVMLPFHCCVTSASLLRASWKRLFSLLRCVNAQIHCHVCLHCYAIGLLRYYVNATGV